MIDLRLGDCLELMPDIEDASIDAVIADIPYGTTACKWDTVIPFAPMWVQLKRVAKPKAAIVLFGSQPFTSALVMSNVEMFRYEWIWNKKYHSNPFIAKQQPLRIAEYALVFSHGGESYFPQMRERPQAWLRERPSYGHKNSEIFGKSGKPHPNSSTRPTMYPTNIIDCALESPNGRITLHPTQKPVALMEYLIRTYTNEGDTVLDFTMGSGSTGVAAVNTRRKFIGIEKDAGYFEIAQRRVSEAQQQMALPLEAA